MLKDSFGRIINNLRISVTDRCNFRCTYCMPESGMKWIDKKKILSYEELFSLIKIFSDLGINKIRLTGGEPLIRQDLYKLIFLISNIEKIEDISLTTNGYYLAEMADSLYNSGLKRINISLDSLNKETFKQITRRDYLQKVLDGIDKSIQVGFNPIKINAVIIKGVNDQDIHKFAIFAREKNVKVRFIEFMPIGSNDGWNNNKVVTSKEIIQIIEQKTGLELNQIESGKSDPATKFMFKDGIGEIGFINSVSEPFCDNCDRIRLTSDGKLRTCLFSLNETDLKQFIRCEKPNKKIIKELILEAVSKKEKGHSINKPGFIRPERTMSQIGG